MASRTWLDSVPRERVVVVDVALLDGFGDLHEEQVGHGHLVDAVGQVVGLFQSQFALLVYGPGDHAAPGKAEHEHHGNHQPQPDLVVVQGG